jgi:CRP-like cAMP-binding protein
MAPLTVFDQIALHPFLHDLPTGWLQRLAVHGRMVLRHPGHRLFGEEAPADRFWLLRSGSVALDFHVPGRGDIVIERIGSGSVVGWSWLLPPHRWSMGAVVADECRAIELDAAGVRTLIAEDPDLGRELTMRFVAVMAERLGAARHRLVELYAYPDVADLSGPARRDRPL